MMEKREYGVFPEYSTSDGMQLALAYLSDPSDVACPHCGPNTMEVVAYLDADRLRAGDVARTAPDRDYTVVLYCRECHRGAALELSPTEERSASPPHV